MQDALRSRRLLGATAAALLLTIAAALSFAAFQAYRSEMDEWRSQLDNTSLLLAQQTANEMSAVELLLDGMLERIAALHIDSEEALRQRMSVASEYHDLLARKKTLPQIDVATIADSSGNVVASTRAFPAVAINLADRDYFLAQRDQARRGSFLGRPVRNRVNGEWTFYLSRRISASDGRFLGVAVVGMSSRRLGEFFSRIHLGGDASVALCRKDFVVLARWPGATGAAGAGDCRAGAREILEGGRGQRGVAVVAPARRAQAAREPVRMVALRVVPDHPLLVAVSVTEALYTRQWRDFALQLASVGVLCGLAVGAAFILLHREMRRRDEALLRQRALQDEADAANRAKSDFLAMISHEIRTPLTSVIGFAEQIEHARGAREAAELGGVIARNGQTLLALINDILDMSKMESGGLALEQVPFAPRDAVAAVALLLSGQARQRGLGFDAGVAPDCPAALVGDPTRWRQILMNLVSNAIKFTERGGVSVQVWYEAPAQMLHCRVSDTGIGMDGGQVARLFKPFAQADGSIARRFGGTGLGLYLVRQLAHAMGGAVEVDTAPGAGTRIGVSIRAVPAAAPVAPVRPAPPAPTRLKGCVLLVEDGEDNRRLIEALLRHRGLDVLCATNGEQGVTTALREYPDLVLMDIQMPVLDGLAAVRRLRAAGFRAPVVALTANVLPRDRERYRLEGFDLCLAKPIEREAFDRALARYLPAAGAPVGFSDLPEFADLHTAFVDSLAARLVQMRAALEQGDLAVVRQAAHMLKGSAATFGCPRVGTAAAGLERSCIAADLAGSRAAMDALLAATQAEAPAALPGGQARACPGTA